MTKGRLLVALALVPLLAAALWGGFWLLTAADVRQRIEATAAGLSAKGMTFTYQDLSFGGFPFPTMTVTLEGLKIEAPDATVAMPRVTFTAPIVGGKRLGWSIPSLTGTEFAGTEATLTTGPGEGWIDIKADGKPGAWHAGLASIAFEFAEESGDLESVLVGELLLDGAEPADGRVAWKSSPLTVAVVGKTESSLKFSPAEGWIEMGADGTPGAWQARLPEVTAKFEEGIDFTVQELLFEGTGFSGERLAWTSGPLAMTAGDEIKIGRSEGWMKTTDVRETLSGRLQELSFQFGGVGSISAEEFTLDAGWEMGESDGEGFLTLAVKNLLMPEGYGVAGEAPTTVRLAAKLTGIPWDVAEAERASDPEAIMAALVETGEFTLEEFYLEQEPLLIESSGKLNLEKVLQPEFVFQVKAKGLLTAAAEGGGVLLSALDEESLAPFAELGQYDGVTDVLETTLETRDGLLYLGPLPLWYLGPLPH